MVQAVAALPDDDIVGVVGEKKHPQKIQRTQLKLNECIAQFNAQVQAGEDASNILAQIQTELSNAQQLTQSGLPTQTDQKNKAFVSDGVTANWQYAQGYSAFETTGRLLVAGDNVFFSLSTEQTCSYPANIVQRQPIKVGNNLKSLADLILSLPSNATYTIEGKENMTPGDTLRVKPGESFMIQGISSTTATVM
ncbi:hypothetical protein SG34_010610 [Thalassomonas viridans]|uniref:Uncharacterized protein n=1 Tax=Thalassomonas viridans TaxID=137584 RepID=A0AAE9Z6T2_9GAMM|nr:hypothetical protein [Thalassomonas viridans]WDE07297.1 hypothetical protein SG34_010610 [Thalassomonas viridans]